MTQRSGFWNDAITGDANLLTENAADGIGYRFSNEEYVSPWVDIFMRAILNGTGNRGVLKGWLNELAVTGVATPVAVDTGAAIIYGLWYENDSSLNVAIPSPTNDTRIDRIVIRRNWIDGTARITRIEGTEGGGAPAMTQSAAPGGSGIYDIPLAQCSITTGGVIAVTDEREYCTFSTVAVDNSVATATIVNEAVDFAARDTTSKSVFFGGSDLLPLAGSFAYDEDNTTLDGSVTAAWGANAATMEGWQCSGSGTAQDRCFFVAFRPPADYVPDTEIEVRAWFIDDWAGATSIYFRSAWQIYTSNGEPELPGSYTSNTVSLTSVLDTVHMEDDLATIPGLDGDELILYCVMYYNSAGAELMLFTGIEFLYTGYV